MGKSYAARAARAGSKREAEALAEEGLEAVAAVYRKGAGAVDGLKDMAKQLRRLPVVDLALPTVRANPLLTLCSFLGCFYVAFSATGAHHNSVRGVLAAVASWLSWMSITAHNARPQSHGCVRRIGLVHGARPVAVKPGLCNSEVT